jgi:hypothetical protein
LEGRSPRIKSSMVRFSGPLKPSIIVFYIVEY